MFASSSGRFLAVLVTLVFLPGSVWAAAQAPDTDGDGISDRNEEILGTDPHYAEPLQVILDDGRESPQRQQRPEYDPTKDILQIEFCHVGGDRYLWRATLAKPPRLEDTVFHLYVDADADETTGRKEPEGAVHRGTDYMLSVVGGRARSTYYAPEGHASTGPPVSHAVQDNAILVSADLPIAHSEGKLRYGLYVLCHTLSKSGGEKPAMSDSSGKTQIAGVPFTDRPKIMRPRDYPDNYRMVATFGVHRLQQIEADPANVVVPHDALETDGFSIDQFTTRRWPHLKRDRSDARAWTTAPESGRYHVGFMMYDDSNDERVAVLVDDQLVGVAVANKDNNTTWLYCTEEAFDFRKGQRVQLQAAGTGGKHGICNIMFLATRPEPRSISYKIENLTAVVLPNRPDTVIVSWTTTWPCPTRFEYGTGENYGCTATQPYPCLVHRVVLDRLDPAVVYHGRAIGTRRDGSLYRSDDFVFRLAPPAPPKTQAHTTTVPLTIRNEHPVDARQWPITTGIPFPQSVLGSAEHVQLADPQGNEVPLQLRVTGRWPDGSIKWLLITFLADVPAGNSVQYQLQFGRNVHRATVDSPLQVTAKETTGGVTVSTGGLQFRIDPRGNLVDLQPGGQPSSPEGAACHTAAADPEGNLYDTQHAKAEITVEEAGPIRAVIKTVAPLQSADGSRLLRVEKRIEAYANCPFVRVRHTLVFDRQGPKFTAVDWLTYRVRLPGEKTSWQVPTSDGESILLDASAPRVWQQFDGRFVCQPAGETSSSQGRITGTAVAARQEGWAVAMRDFWQNYPKGFRVTAGGLDVELCPPFDTGPYDAFPFEKEGHQLYYYLLEGRYRFKVGVAKTHELLLCCGSAEQRRAVCTLFQHPLLATAPPEWYCRSDVFYDVAPRNTEQFRLYEEAIDRNLKAYVERRERQHDFGMLNYGDWYGERGANWGNVEYDTQHAFFLEYIRSGNPAAFFLGEATELHNRDIDTVHYSTDPRNVGAVYVHQMCHVGGYYEHSVPGTLGFPQAGYTVSHAWVEGHFEHYHLTGDRRSWETACAVADFFARKQLSRPYDFSSTRVPGWHLIMLAAAYHATGDPYYLNAAKVIVEHVLETQDVQPRPLPEYQRQGRQPYQLGGWSRMMVPGHCRCEPRHRGNAGFMIAVLLSGLKYYHEITGDERVKEAIVRGAHYLLDETYSDQVHGFRYTSCPRTEYRPGATPLMVEGIARAYLWTHDQRFRRVLVDALPLSAGGSSYGKGFSMYYRCAPRVLADMAAAGITLNRR